MIPDRSISKCYPPTAQHVLREGKVTARNIVASLYGGKKLRVALDWTLDVLFSKYLVQFVSFRGDQAMSHQAQQPVHSEPPREKVA